MTDKKTNWFILLERYAYVCLLILILRIPFSHTEALKSFALITGFLASVIASIWRKDFKWGKIPGDWPLLLFLIWSALASLAGNNPFESLDHLRGSFLQYFMGYILASRLSWNRKRMETFISALLVPGLIIGVMTLFGSGEYAKGTFHWHTQLAWFLILTVPIYIPLIEHSSKPWLKIITGLTIGMGIISLVQTNSRGGYLSFALIMILLLWLSKREVKQVSGVLVGLFLLIILTTPAGRDRFGKIFNPDTYMKDRISYRLDTWKAGFKMIAERPVLGVGYGHKRYEELFKKYADTPELGYMHAHNTMIQITVETGLYGCIIFVWFCFVMARGFWRDIFSSKDQFRRSIAVVYFAMFCGWFLFGMTTYTFYRHPNGLLQMLIFGSYYYSNILTTEKTEIVEN